MRFYGIFEFLPGHSGHNFSPTSGNQTDDPIKAPDRQRGASAKINSTNAVKTTKTAKTFVTLCVARKSASKSGAHHGSAGNAPSDSRQHFDVWSFAMADKDAGQQSYFGAVPPQTVIHCRALPAPSIW